FITLVSPSGAESSINSGEHLSIIAESSSTATSMSLWLDTGSGYSFIKSVTNAQSISHSYFPTTSGNIKIKITATINGQSLEKTQDHFIVIKRVSVIAPVPPGMKNGVNYHPTDPTRVTLVLLAPHKDFVYVVGDFTAWQTNDLYLMKKSPDGERFWLEITNLTPQTQYVYQFWIDGNIKVADPYTEKVADPWNDQYIPSMIYPDLPTYNRTEYGIASVLQTQQSKYNWSTSEANWKKPDVNHLVIYELHMRDFLQSHWYQDLIDTISYIKRLGVNAIELMPINEFEGNDSWGYNPSFYFAPDKYYGTKDQLKQFIDVAHQHGIAVILDMVLNHAFGQCPMVQMYFDKLNNKPAADNPWFNKEYVGQYQWGYDFNHESPYTQDFIDQVNAFWLNEYHLDGFRFDFTKGFTNYAPNGSIDGYDASRIVILKRMMDQIRTHVYDAYVILEHWSPANEEAELGNYGMKMWRNKSYDFVPATVGEISGSFYDVDATTHVTLVNSHDERRLAEHCLTEGRYSGLYNVKDTVIMYERVKMAAAFLLLQPGPKMMWQFDELGYDVDINFNGRVGRKPLPWGSEGLSYYTDSLRQHIYKTYQGILHVRNSITPQVLATAVTNHKHSGDIRRLTYDTPEIDLVVVGNYSLQNQSVDGGFAKIGRWYDYFSGDSISVINANQLISLQPGEWHIYTSKRLRNGQPDVVAIFDQPVTITPFPFNKNDQITIRFDATKATRGGTAGLIGAEKVYIHSGLVLNGVMGNTLTNVVGNLIDNGIGQMKKIGTDLWEISLTAKTYYAIAENQEIDRIGMWFRNGDNSQRGFGFRDQMVFVKVQSDQPIVTIQPQTFEANTEITVIFDARQGNGELAITDKIYMHSSVGTINTSSPESTAWSKVVGTWGKDDGIGLMSPVPGQPGKWQIKLRPKDYYGLTANEYPFWVACVFRNASGSIKGTTQSGPLPNGFVAPNKDYFIKNGGLVSIAEIHFPDLKIYPNPANEWLTIEGVDGSYIFQLHDLSGAMITSDLLVGDKMLDISDLASGMYIYTVMQTGRIKRGKLTIL
ncbi:MAG: alpha-amylase family glycosyl hydrolase, partial [Saprospiraceae bacterium]